MNIDEFKDVEPMKYWSLAAGASDAQKKKLEKAIRGNEYYATLKRDGAWYKFIKDDNEFLLQSRTLSKKTGRYVEKQDNVPHIIEELNVILPDQTVVIGEIFSPIEGSISSDVISVMGCLPAKAISRQKDIKMRYYIFDILMYDGMDVHDQPAEKRIGLLQKIKKEKANMVEHIEFAEPIFDDLEEQVGVWLENGEEGGVLMHRQKPYKFGRSPAWHTIKFKQSLASSIDLVITGFSPPVTDYTGKYVQGWTYWENMKTGKLEEGRYYADGGYRPVSEYYFKGMVGGFELAAYYGDKLIPVGKVANLTDELRAQATNHPEELLNTVVEVSAMSIDMERKSLRHAKLIKLRPDKDAKECLYSSIF